MREVVNVMEFSSGPGSNREERAILTYHCQISRPQRAGIGFRYGQEPITVSALGAIWCGNFLDWEGDAVLKSLEEAANHAVTLPDITLNETYIRPTR
jgi:hypothetical protein